MLTAGLIWFWPVYSFTCKLWYVIEHRQPTVCVYQTWCCLPRYGLSSGHYMYCQFNIHKLHVLPTQCIYVFCVDLRINSDHRFRLIFVCTFGVDKWHWHRSHPSQYHSTIAPLSFPCLWVSILFSDVSANSNYFIFKVNTAWPWRCPFRTASPRTRRHIQQRRCENLLLAARRGTAAGWHRLWRYSAAFRVMLNRVPSLLPPFNSCSRDLATSLLSVATELGYSCI